MKTKRKNRAGRPSDADLVLNTLTGHGGAEAAITSREVCLELGWPVTRERDVRAIVETYANGPWEGTLCAIPGKGYFFARTIEEVAAYRALLVSLRNTAKEKLHRFDLAAERSGLSLAGVPS